MNRIVTSRVRLIVLALVSVCGFLLPAHSDPYSEPMTFEIQTTDFLCPECTIINAVGVIQPSTADEFREFLNKYPVPSGSLVDFDSPGGSLMAGIELGVSIRSKTLRTSVGMTASATEGSCASACAYAFLGGVERIVHPKSKFGIHKFYGDILSSDAVELTQDVIANLLDYTSSMGISADLVKTASGTSSQMTWLSAKQRSELRVTTEDFIDGGSIWRIDSKMISGWQVQENGRIVHFDFGCPQLVLSVKKEAEIREQLARQFSWNQEIEKLSRKQAIDRLRWSQQYRLDVHYFEHRDESLGQQCSLSTDTGGFQCSLEGAVDGKVPVEFSADLPWTKFSGHHHDFYGMSKIERNTVRLRTEVSKVQFEHIISRSKTGNPIQIIIEPDVTFRGEQVIDQLTSNRLVLTLPKVGLADAGNQLLSQCEYNRR